MNNERVLLTVLALLMPVSFAVAQDKPDADLATLQAENKTLRENIAKLKEQNAAMEKKLAEALTETKRLSQLCKSAGISTAAATTAPATPTEAPPPLVSLDELMVSIDAAVIEYERVERNQRSSTGIEQQENSIEQKEAREKLEKAVPSLVKDKTLSVECRVGDISMNRDKTAVTIRLKDFKFTKRVHVSIAVPSSISLRMTLEQAKEIKKGDHVVFKGPMTVKGFTPFSDFKYTLKLPNVHGSFLAELHYTSYACTINSKAYEPG